MDLVLVRHGEPVRIEGAEGAADPPLTERGLDQARAVAYWLHEAESLDAVVASPLRRARQTAEPIAEAYGLTVEIDEELAEFDREAPDYVPVEELKATNDPRWEALASDRWHELHEDLDPEVFRATVVGAVERIVETHPGQRAAAVCHGGVINIYLAHVLGIDRDLWFEPEYTSISRVAASRRGHRTIVSVNESAHLRGLEAPQP